MDLPEDLDAHAVDEFNDFCTREHLPEMLADAPGLYKVATRYELMTPSPGCPRFLATYQVASRSDGSRFAERIASRGPHPPTPGPVAWLRKEAAGGSCTPGLIPAPRTAATPVPVYGLDHDSRNTTPEGLAEFNEYYTNVHVPDVVAAYPGFVNGSR